jgi:hypothetical protein
MRGLGILLGLAALATAVGITFRGVGVDAWQIDDDTWWGV